MVALDADRVKEKAVGTVRRLRHDFQAPEETRRRGVQTEMLVAETSAPDAAAWQGRSMCLLSPSSSHALIRGPACVQDMTRRFKGAPRGAGPTGGGRALRRLSVSGFSAVFPHTPSGVAGH